MYMCSLLHGVNIHSTWECTLVHTYIHTVFYFTVCNVHLVHMYVDVCILDAV